MSTRVQILGPSPQRAAIAAQQREQQLANYINGLTTEIELLRSEVIALRAGMPPDDVPQTPPYDGATVPQPRTAAPQNALAAIPSPTGALTPTVNAAAPVPGTAAGRPRPPMRQNLIAGAGAPGGGETFTSKDGSKVQLLGPVANVRAAGAPGAAPPTALGFVGTPKASTAPRFMPPILQQPGAPIGKEIVNADGSKVLLLATPLATRPRPNQPPQQIAAPAQAPAEPAPAPAPSSGPVLEKDRFDLIEID